MKITLIRKNSWPPGGWQFIQPQIPYTNPKPLAGLDHIVEELVLVRSRNPRHKLSTDQESALNDILVYNFTRLGPDQRAKFFVTDEQVADSKKKPPASLSQRVAGVVDSVKQAFVGTKTLIEAFGGSGRPVSQELADKRAAVCLSCPLNVDKGESFKTKVAEKIKDLIEAKNHLDLHAKGEEGLYICDACGCHLPLKVWTPLTHIIENLPGEDYEKLHPNCWVRAEKKTLILVLPFCEGDFSDLKLLLQWMGELGGLKTRKCVLFADCKMFAHQKLDKVLGQACEIFGEVDLRHTPNALPDERWPVGANWMWLSAAKHMQQLGHPWFWCEPDCIPLRAGWLDDLERDYEACGKPFMGSVLHKMPGTAPLVPEVHMNGNAIYPADAFTRIGHVVTTQPGVYASAFDMATSGAVVPNAANTDLIQHFWGELDLSPVFLERLGKGDPKNTLPLSFIRKDAAVFHRSKGGSLIRLLRRKGSRQIVHVTERHSTQSADHPRIFNAFNSWVTIYKGGSQIRPLHIWEWQYKRNSLAIGDKRAMPYLKDILQSALIESCDAVMLTNDDSVLHPDTPAIVNQWLNTKPAFSSFRINFSPGHSPDFSIPIDRLPKPADGDIGRDLFVFTRGWLSGNWNSIPDFLLGELEWDLVLALLIRKSYGLACSGKTIGKRDSTCELPNGYVWHERHERAWTKANFYNPSKQHNWKLASDWCAKNGVEYPFG